ncbi:hypothetical protein FB45DRAFT_936670 [Roridomyces roridus]|uniref:Uncharacterized protein n=1 Tax=Roridomyces roridus TaxID=1738132 RepID=A0AAD7FDU0_9AGAR|nr:hypothetical protein FB45DRAFT_936670 [Roridomyces roridus]
MTRPLNTRLSHRGTDTAAAQLRILRDPVPDSILDGIRGNAPRDVKEVAVKWLKFFTAPAEQCFYGLSSERKVVTEVSLNPDPLEDMHVLTLVCEIVVTEELLDWRGKLGNAFVISVIDECVSSAVTALDYAEGGSGICGVSQSLNTVLHNFVDFGASLRFVNTTLTATPGTTACRSEVWDLTQRRLVATAVYIGMPSSSPSPPLQRAARL